MRVTVQEVRVTVQEVMVTVQEVKVVVADLSLNFCEVHFQIPVEEEVRDCIQRTLCCSIKAIMKSKHESEIESATVSASGTTIVVPI